MAGLAARRKEHQVERVVVVWPGDARRPHFGRGGAAAEAILVDREVEILGGVAPFDLDEGDDAPAPRNQIDFTDRDAKTLAQNPPAVEPQPPGGAAFGLAPARFGRGAFHAGSFPASLSVRARA